VAVDASYIYVADSGNNRVQIFSRSTRAYVATVGTGSGIGDYQFHTPTDVAVDAAGNLYVADVYNNRVQQYNSGWVYQRTYGTTGVPYLTDGYHYNYPTGVAVAGDGSIYVVESRGKRLVKLNAAGVPQWTVGEPGISGTDNSHFRYPQGVALDGAGHVYVADTSNDRIQIFNSDGTYYATLGTGSGSGPYQFDSPYGVAVGQNGNIYVADRYNHRIQIYNADGAYIGTIGTTGVAGSDNSHFNEPHDVAVDSAGNVYSAITVFRSALLAAAVGLVLPSLVKPVSQEATLVT
jgi:sugar lactone lactonase YvrE